MTVSTPRPPDILSAEHDLDPHASYEILRDHYPVVYHEGTNAWLVSRHEDQVRVLRNKDEIDSENYSWMIAPVHGRTIINLESKEHTMHRRLLSPFFHRGGLESFLPTIERVARELTESWLAREAEAVASGETARGEVDLVPNFIHQFPISVIEEMLALPRKDHADFERWYGAIMEYIANLGGEPGPIERGLQARREMTEYFLPLIRERRSGEGADLLTLMCQAEVDGGRLSDEEVRAFVSLMLTAGGETTDRVIGNMFMRLIEHPEQLQAVYQDHSLVADAFAETLRHTPPVHVAARHPKVDIEIQGVTIPAGSTIICLLGAANRDPRRFSEPDRFDIFRSDNDTSRAFTASADHLGFANGRHFCVGAMLARSEVMIGSSRLLDHMRDLRFADGFEPRQSGLFTRGLDSLKVSYIPA